MLHVQARLQGWLGTRGLELFEFFMTFRFQNTRFLAPSTRQWPQGAEGVTGFLGTLDFKIRLGSKIGGKQTNSTFHSSSLRSVACEKTSIQIWASASSALVHKAVLKWSVLHRLALRGGDSSLLCKQIGCCCLTTWLSGFNSCIRSSRRLWVDNRCQAWDQIYFYPIIPHFILFHPWNRIFHTYS